MDSPGLIRERLQDDEGAVLCLTWVMIRLSRTVTVMGVGSGSSTQPICTASLSSC